MAVVGTGDEIFLARVRDNISKVVIGLGLSRIGKSDTVTFAVRSPRPTASRPFLLQTAPTTKLLPVVQLRSGVILLMGDPFVLLTHWSVETEQDSGKPRGQPGLESQPPPTNQKRCV
jgi:hypothetical protein